ncbi:hypothetical protein ACLKA7_012081 [Drosophila subpalustris]
MAGEDFEVTKTATGAAITRVAKGKGIRGRGAEGIGSKQETQPNIPDATAADVEQEQELDEDNGERISYQNAVRKHPFG